MLKRYKETNLSLNNEKCHMLQAEGIVLGRCISMEGIKLDPTNIKVIVNLPTPKSQKEVRSFLGHDGYCRHFIEDFSKIASPLFLLLCKDSKFDWDDDCQASFEELKKRLSATPILRGLDWSLPFHISTNSLDTTIGVVLGKHEEKKPYAIYFITKNISLAELNYIVIEKQFLALLYVINKLCHYTNRY